MCLPQSRSPQSHFRLLGFQQPLPQQATGFVTELCGNCDWRRNVVSLPEVAAAAAGYYHCWGTLTAVVAAVVVRTFAGSGSESEPE